ncbi:hypothetical protein DD238_008211 [Peronospora effusa]|uniref:Uncharacterized protein n=1 Tax=Peronospora effusa TaxID=542832 RepID=A0A3M6V7I5_9STRA|nr:hypothetical protein DD238_008211 [Peronospora effusa]RQM15207.1 hypothetical protein DD237_002670 [Peronospora effusa]
MEPHDAIITWLEQGDNFLRVTNILSRSPSTDQYGAKLARAESKALDELVGFVNLSIPHANLDAKSTRLMLKQYLFDYKSTVEAAANLQSSLDEKDQLDEVKTVQDKLNARCPHFQRLEQLYARFVMKERQDEKNSQCNEENKEQQMTNVQLQSSLLDTQGNRKVKDVTPKKTRTVKKKKKVKTSSESTATEKKKKDLNSNEEAETEQMLATKNGKNKKTEKDGKSQTKKHRKSKKQSLKEKKVIPASSLIVLSSDGEEDKTLPILRRSARSKKRASRSLEESTDRSDDASLWIGKRKLRRVESASELTCREDALDVTLTQTTQTTYAASDGSQGPTVSEKNTPSGKTPTKASENKQKSPTSKPAEPESSSSATPRRKRLAKVAVSHPLAKGRNSTSCSQKSTQNTAVPNALRSAIAQAVSQRQQLLSRSQAERCQRSTSESDYGLSDIDLPEPSVSCNGPRSSDNEARPSIGLLPPLIERSLITDGRANLERKRVFLRAKELAFEQLKWQRENEFQQQELELLRYETEAREALARQELRIKQMRLRATIIQPMISAGASVTDIVERLELL